MEDESVNEVESKGRMSSARRYASLELRILLYVLEMRYMNFGQIKNKFFEEIADQDSLKAFNILNRLLAEGLLKSKDKTLGSNSLFLVTDEGRNLLASIYKNRRLPERQKNVFMPVINHDLHLTNLRIRFEQLGFIKKWVCENQLKEIPLFLREFSDLPKALCKKVDGKSYFLELEISPKNPKMYREKIENYLRILKLSDVIEQKIEGVIFFCLKKDVIEKIKEQIPPGTKNISVMLYENYFRDEMKAFILKNKDDVKH